MTGSPGSGVDDYPVIHSIRTHVLKYGEIDKHKRLVVVIPGNPGAIEFYDEFMKLVHQSSGWPVWGLSHAGHSTVPEDLQWQVPDPDVFTLEGQRQHKAHFLTDYVPKDVEVVLIGHSIGSQLVLDAMDRIPADRVKEGMLLFPTIERMAVSPEGKRLTPLLKYMRWLLVLLSACVWILPRSLKMGLISWFLGKRKSPEGRRVPGCIKSAALNLLDPYCVANATYMANIEMREVVDLRKDIVEQHLPKLRFYYGATDHWCPKQYYHDMKNLFPDHKKIHLCTDGLKHAFIIDGNEVIAEKVNRWLSEL